MAPGCAVTLSLLALRSLRYATQLILTNFARAKPYPVSVCRQKKPLVDSEAEDQQSNDPELTRMEIEMAKQNFSFYQQNKKVSAALELYELSMILSACGYRVSPV